MRIAIDVSSLTGGQQAGGRVSFLQDVRLTVTSADDAFTLTETLAPTDSIATFDVTVNPGSVDFAVEVYSNASVLVYTGDTTAVIDADDFVVTIIVNAVAPVMVVSPDTAIAQVVGVPGGPFASTTLMVRNAGNDTLTWSFDSAASDGNFSCSVQQRIPCTNVRLAPTVQVAAGFSGSTNTPGIYAITFVSMEGTVVARIRIP